MEILSAGVHTCGFCAVMVLIMREGLRAKQRRLVGEKVWFHGERESCIIPRLVSALCFIVV